MVVGFVLPRINRTIHKPLRLFAMLRLVSSPPSTPTRHPPPPPHPHPPPLFSSPLYPTPTTLVSTSAMPEYGYQLQPRLADQRQLHAGVLGSVVPLSNAFLPTYIPTQPQTHAPTHPHLHTHYHPHTTPFLSLFFYPHPPLPNSAMPQHGYELRPVLADQRQLHAGVLGSVLPRLRAPQQRFHPASGRPHTGMQMERGLIFDRS